MAMFRALRRVLTGRQNDIRAYKRFDHLNTTDQARIVYHGDSRPFAEIEKAKGLKRYIQAPNTSKPLIMAGGGTKNTVTTTTCPAVAATYATRANAVHNNPGEFRYIYAMFIPSGEGIDLLQLPRSRELEEGKMSDNNARSQEILVLDVPLRQLLGYVTIEKTRRSTDHGKWVEVAEEYVDINEPNASSITREDFYVFADYKVATSFPIIEV